MCCTHACRHKAAGKTNEYSAFMSVNTSSTCLKVLHPHGVLWEALHHKLLHAADVEQVAAWVQDTRGGGHKWGRAQAAGS